MKVIAFVVIVLAVIVVVAPPSLVTAQSTKPDKVLFISSRDSADKKGFDIFTMKPDGSEPTNLTKSEVNEFDPAWSPDGKLIAFVVFTRGATAADSKGDLFVMNADGSGRKQLTKVEADTIALSPTWSPDGKRLAYCVVHGFGIPKPTGFIETMKPDGTDVTRLRDGFLPAWSPDGKRMLFTVIESDQPALHIMDADAGNAKQLQPAKSMLGAWSPDGARIAFMKEGGTDQPDLFVMDADGGNLKQLTMTPEMEFGGAWSPDGKRVYITRVPMGMPMTTSIWAYAPDGSSASLIGDGANIDFIGMGGVFMMRAM